MTTQAYKKSNFGKYFWYKIKTLQTRIILMVILGVLSFPILSGSGMLLLNIIDRGDPTNEMFMEQNSLFFSFFVSSVVICSISLLIMLFMGYFIAISNFSYLHNRNIVDMNYSLPLSRPTRFWADFLSGLAVYTIPYIVSCIVGFGIYLFGSYLLRSEGLYKETVLHYIPTVLSYMLAGLVLFVLLYLFTLLLVSACGNLLEASSYPLIMSLAIPGAIALVVGCAIINARGVDFGNIVFDAIGSSSPLGYFIMEIANLVNNAMSDLQSYPPLSGIFNWSISIPLILILGVMLALSFYMNKVRKPENTGKSFAFSWVYHIIMTLVMFCYVGVFLLIRYTADGDVGSDAFFIILMVVLSFITFLIIDVITNRGFKRFGFSTLRYLAMMTGSVIVVSLLIASKGFMMGYYVPEIQEVKSVETNLLLHVESNNQLGNATFESEEAIGYIRAIHKEWTEMTDEEYEGTNVNYDTYETDESFAFISYYLENGNKVSRNYVNSSYQPNFRKTQLENLYRLYVTQESKNIQNNNIDKLMKNELISSNLFFNLSGQDLELSEQQTAEFFDAYKKDISELTFELLSDPNRANIGSIDLRLASSEGIINFYEFKIYSHMTHTIQAMQEMGIKFLSVQEIIDNAEFITLSSSNGSVVSGTIILEPNHETKQFLSEVNLRPVDKYSNFPTWNVTLSTQFSEANLLIDEKYEEKVLDLFYNKIQSIDEWDNIILINYGNNQALKKPNGGKKEQRFNELLETILAYNKPLFLDEKSYLEDMAGEIYLSKTSVNDFYRESNIYLLIRETEHEALKEFIS